MKTPATFPMEMPMMLRSQISPIKAMESCVFESLLHMGLLMASRTLLLRGLGRLFPKWSYYE